MAIGWRLAHLPWLLAAAGAMLVAAAVVGWFGRGGVGAAGAALGVAAATASYLLSTLVIAWADAVRPALLLPLGLASYVVKICALGGVMLALMDRDWPGLVPMALGVVAGAVAWSAAQIWWVARRGRSPGELRPRVPPEIQAQKAAIHHTVPGWTARGCVRSDAYPADIVRRVMVDDQSPQGSGGTPPGAGAHQAWSVLSYLIAGIGVWGLIGWLVDRWLDLDGVATAVGVLAGGAGGIYLIIRRSWISGEG